MFPRELAEGALWIDKRGKRDCARSPLPALCAGRKAGPIRKQETLDEPRNASQGHISARGRPTREGRPCRFRPQSHSVGLATGPNLTRSCQ